MNTKLFGAAGAALIALSMTVPGSAAIAGQNSVLPNDGNLAGYEIRVNLPGHYAPTDHLWRFNADGTVSGVSFFARTGARGGTFSETNADNGTWSIQDGAVCVQFGGQLSEANGCYHVQTTGGRHIIMTPVDGRGAYKGTLAPIDRP